ncbi:inverse autotransporter beta domain-containing protein [Pelagibacterales bacterium SAG-MED48]|nr:inverse autotransporter beta domain-containing protein [Pelagibacterales bacterium SAG-MED48]
MYLFDVKKIILISTLLVFGLSAHAADIKNKFMNNFNSYLNDSLGQLFPTSEVSLSSGTTNEVTGSILVIKPLSDINDNENILFTQGSLFLSDESRETLNLGIGKRKLVNDDTLLIGANLFYDHELDYDHQRASVGIEAISSVGSFRLNQYYGLSGWTAGLDNVQEKALNGQDIEVGAPLPYLPWTNLYYRSFNWDGASGATDLEGDEISLEAKFSNFNVEVGKRSNDGVTEDEEFLKITYTCCNNSNSEVGISDTAYNLTSVADQKFAKVRRQNLIVKQKEMDLTVIGF